MKKNNKWSVLFVMAMAAFIMVIDSTAMNVSISNLVADLDTDIGTIQTIMALYTLIMAVFMLPGAKIADIFGKKKIFLLGVCLYGVGTLTAAIAVNTTMLFIGWAVIEGLASSMMMPTALSLISSAYTGKDRAVAMSIYTAISSVALAIGPIFGGLITTYLSWRFVFALEVLIVIFIIVKNKTIRGIECPAGDRTERFDIPGTILAMLSLLCIILGALLSSTYGWFTPKAPFTAFGFTLTGVSVTFVLLCVGVVLLVIQAAWLLYAKKHGKPVLIDVTVFTSRLYDFVLLINFSVQMCLMGTMFIVSLYLQNVLQYNALSTGLTLIPLSVLLFITSLIAVRVTQKVPAHFVIAFGAVAIFAGSLYMYLALTGGGMVIGVQMFPSMVLLGIGIGCTLSMTSNIGLSAIDPIYANQGSGMITTINNFGSSLSTSLMGSLFTGGVAGGILSAIVKRNPDTLGILSTEEVVAKLQAGFEKIRIMQVTLEDLTAGQLAAVQETVVQGVDLAMLPIFMIIMVMALVAAVVALFFLKPKA